MHAVLLLLGERRPFEQAASPDLLYTSTGATTSSPDTQMIRKEHSFARNRRPRRHQLQVLVTRAANGRHLQTKPRVKTRGFSFVGAPPPLPWKAMPSLRHRFRIVAPSSAAIKLKGEELERIRIPLFRIWWAAHRGRG